MPRTHKFNARSEGMVKISTTERVDYSKFATPEWNLIVSFFRAYPDIMEDICEGDRAEYSNSLMNRVTKRYMARYRETFTFASRGYGKTSCLISDKCNKGILWPGEITGYYAPSEKQAAPLASKAFAGWERNVPLLAAHWRRINDSTDRFAVATINGSRFIMDIDRGIDTSGVVAEECAQEDRNPFNWTDFNQIVLGTNRLEHKANGVSVPSHIDSQIHYISSCSRQENESYSVYKSVRQEMQEGGSAFALSIVSSSGETENFSACSILFRICFSIHFSCFKTNFSISAVLILSGALISGTKSSPIESSMVFLLLRISLYSIFLLENSSIDCIFAL